MTRQEFPSYRRRAISQYAAELVRAGASRSSPLSAAEVMGALAASSGLRQRL
jgi:hypothetical protein